MPVLQEHCGGYDHRGMIEIFGSFRTNVADPPDVLRDGKTASFSVERDSAGLFTVTLTGTHPLPEIPVIEFAYVQPGSDTPVLTCTAGIIAGSWDPAERTFQILVEKVGDTGASAYFDSAPADPDDLTRVGFFIKGSIESAGTDAA